MTIPIFFPGKIPWTRETGGLQSVRLQELDMTEHTYTHKHIQKYTSLLSSPKDSHQVLRYSVIISLLSVLHTF